MVINSIKSKLDDIKTTITISMGTKNLLRKLKNDMSYEDFINYLIRIRNEKIHSNCLTSNSNIVTYTKFKVIESSISINDYKIIYKYNKFIQSSDFRFDIQIKSAILNGKRISYKNLIEKHLFKNYLNFVKKEMDKKTLLQINKYDFYKKVEFNNYFKILSKIIQEEIFSNFKHKGSIKDYVSWEKEFKILRLPNSSFEEDIMEKLIDFQRGI